MPMEKEKLLDYLRTLISAPKCELDFADNFQLLIAVILSAQCTDKRVNIVTKDLFAKWDSPQKLANASIEDVEAVVKPCGFYHNKSRNIIDCSKDIVSRFGGQVPDNREDLESLSGVGRKTANVVLTVGLGVPEIPVDTHVYRVSRRLGLSKSEKVRGVEDDLTKLFEPKDWNEVHHLILLFGRYYCTARNPKCAGCGLREICNYRGGK